MPKDAVVVGGSGFVGAAIVAALRDMGVEVGVNPAPRLSSAALTLADLERDLDGSQDEIDALAASFAGATVVINAAGVADAASTAREHLFGANALLPRVVCEAAAKSGARRFVHISSAGVQGRISPLDESSTVAPFSLYTRSKALGEQGLAGVESTIIFRPTSVHGVGRGVTRALAKFARSPLASVAGAGDSPTPQVLVANVGSAVAFLAMFDGHVPSIVMQPWGGLTTAGLIEALGGRTARRVPYKPARWLLSAGMQPKNARIAANVRRLELLWFGQCQVRGWLKDQGWVEPVGTDAWQGLAQALTRR